MVSLFYQVGYSGMFILLLGLLAVFMAIRGIVLIALIKRQGWNQGSTMHDIVSTISQGETVTTSKAPPAPAAAAAADANGAAAAAHTDAQGGSVNRELIINTIMQVRLKDIYSSMYFLKLCAAIGPLLGLLGTVLGMVDVFATLSERSMPDPSLLAGGIWEALLTTVMGLTLAIPALIVHYYLLMSLRSLRNRINLILCGLSPL